MHIGIGRVDITPPVGIDLTGFIAREGPCTGVHDPLFATSLVAVEADRAIALVSCDLIGLGSALVRRVRHQVEERWGIPAAAQMYACTHTHGGPETGVLISLAQPDPAYLEHLEQALIAVTGEAIGKLQEARIGWRQGVCYAAHNRVLARAQKDDTLIDPDVVVVRLTASDGSPIGALVHYTCHPVAAGHAERLATADWCGVVRRELEALGAGPVLVINGAGGDINPRIVQRGFTAVENVGQTIATVAVQLWQEASADAYAGVEWAQAAVLLTLLPLGDAATIANALTAWKETIAREEPEQVAYRAGKVVYRNYAYRLARHYWGSEPLGIYHGETQVLRLGPLTVVALPGEFFSAYGRQIKDRGSTPLTIVAGWANDNLGYFPTAELFPIGGYEMDTAARYYGFPAPWAPESGAAVVTKARALMHHCALTGEGGRS